MRVYHIRLQIKMKVTAPNGKTADRYVTFKDDVSYKFINSQKYLNRQFARLKFDRLPPVKERFQIGFYRDGVYWKIIRTHRYVGEL